MKRLAIIITLIVSCVAGVQAQNDPHGQVDTLYLDKVTVGIGREFIINVNLWNDESLGGVTVPLVYPINKLDFVDLSFAGGRMEYLTSRHISVDESDGTILVGALVYDEDYIPVGNGKLFSLRFRLKETTTPGEVIYIDSTTIPPVAEILLTDSAGQDLYPVFVRGEVEVSTENQAPYFKPVSNRYVTEGDSLYIAVEAIDFEGDEITLTNPIHPFNSDFIDHGDGTGLFAWRPDFVGPNSSDLSPFTFVFTASDGDKSENLHVIVNVINVNRAPEINAPALIEAEAGDSLGISVSALDPDFEAIAWEIVGLPEGASFDYQNPGFINWLTDFADSGSYDIKLIASDPHGKADSANLSIELAPVTFFTVRIDTLTTFAGKVVGLDISLRNKLRVSAVNLLINLDPSVLTPIEVSKTGYRLDHFDFFNYVINAGGNPGDLRITARADNAELLNTGEGVIFRITVQVSSNLSYVGQQVPVKFMTRSFLDNSITAEGDIAYFNEEINLFGGYIRIAAPGISLLGDVNLNGIAFEISDAVYFSNHFVNPDEFPLNEQQTINSDINQDGFAPSVADLVLLVKIVSGGGQAPYKKPLTDNGPARVELIRTSGGLYVRIEVPVAVGGGIFKFRGRDANRIEAENLTGMDLLSHFSSGIFNCLLISYAGKSITSGASEIVRLSADSDLDINLVEVELADTKGGNIEVFKSDGPVLPERFGLYQNRPNPFNPDTEIQFDLAYPAKVSLSIYNVLGQEVIRLVESQYEAGTYSVTWDGIDKNGKPVASGIYLYRIEAGGFVASRKMVLMK